MPATEQTWYNQKLLHVVFGVSSLLMLVATVWMFAADHDREWKGYQRRFRDIELRLTDWRKRASESAAQQATQAELETELQLAKTEPPSRQLLAAFKLKVLKDRLDRSELEVATYEREKAAVEEWQQGQDVSSESFSDLNQLYDRLVRQSTEVTRLQEQVKQSRGRLADAEKAATTLRKQLQDADAAQSEDRKSIEAGLADVEKRLDEADKTVASESPQLAKAVREAADLRSDFIGRLDDILSRAKFREEQLSSRRKFRSADADAAKARLDLAVRDDQTEKFAELQAEIDRIVKGSEDSLESLTKQRQRATAHREDLQSILRDVRQDESEIAKNIESNLADIERLSALEVEKRATWFSPFPIPGKRWLELPILDAFGSPLRIDNLWTDNLTMVNGSFGRVRRFDRCTTCHKGIDKTAPGSATEPAYEPEQVIEVALQTPDTKPQGSGGAPPTLAEIYGITLAKAGLIDDDDVTISIIEPESLAAKAIGLQDAHGNPVPNGLQVGDVIERVNQDKPLDADQARQFLTEGIEWGQPMTLTIRRGLPEPYTSHPRLDLFVGSLSPHPLPLLGCTSCHEGQGSATDFKWASHTPNTPAQRKEWMEEHGWFNNHHWIFPMYPKRFAESSCLKCHHEVADLEASPRFPDPPAPKLVEGWHLVGQYGCYGCHEINGYDGPDRRVGPDLRLEPNYYAAAATVKADPGFANLGAPAQQLTEKVIGRPFDDRARHELRQLLLDDSASDTPQLTLAAHRMADVLQDQDTPGERRKTGPSLRYVAHKLGASFMYDWIRKPSNFRPSTKMPQFFELWDHLDDPDRELAERFEKVEILGMVRYLLDRSQPFEYLQPATGVEPPSVERGKLAFELRGCLACHQHEDFPVSTAIQGPNLTGLADKFASTADAPRAEQWLYSWIKQPTHYHARTKMPDLYLDPITQPDGTITDPVADITAYLLSGGKGWQPPTASVAALTPNETDLDELSLEHLKATFPQRAATRYLAEGIPTEMSRSLKGAEIELVGSASTDQKLLYVGRKAISKYGCYGCHDIPGFEDAKPIGTAMADWGRKESSKLAFEHILEYLHNGGHAAHGEHAAHGAAGSGSTATGHEDQPAPDHSMGPSHEMASHDDETSAAGHAEFDDSFYMDQLAAADRSGFIWQKLTEPRSYDYKKTTNKRYNERLRMPLFPLDPEEREKVITFVLGLVADPPAEEFVYQPDERGAAIVAGRRVLEKYNCGGCHILEAEKWVVQFEPGELGSAPNAVDYPFLASEFSAAELSRSNTPDKTQGVLTAMIEGEPVISNEDATVVVLDEEGDEIDPEEEYDPATLLYPFEPWKSLAWEGKPYEVGLRRLEISGATIRKKYPTRGGDLTMWLLPRVVEVEKETNSSANGTEAWSWLPPPLVGEGVKVQPEWLHSFLLEPYPIRPAVFLRMPKFNMSPAEATQLVDYFAARDAAEYPFPFDDRLLANHLEMEAAKFGDGKEGVQSRLDHAMQIVTNQNYCIKCHLIGNYTPESNQRALAPDLSKVQFRLRPEYVKRWIANPKSILPYTAMPVNIPFDPNSPTLGGVSQEIYPGTSIDQLNGLVDLLMNYSEFMGMQFDVSKLVKASADSNNIPAEDQGATATPDQSSARLSEASAESSEESLETRGGG